MRPQSAARSAPPNHGPIATRSASAFFTTPPGPVSVLPALSFRPRPTGPSHGLARRIPPASAARLIDSRHASTIPRRGSSTWQRISDREALARYLELTKRSTAEQVEEKMHDFAQALDSTARRLAYPPQSPALSRHPSAGSGSAERPFGIEFASIVPTIVELSRVASGP